MSFPSAFQLPRCARDAAGPHACGKRAGASGSVTDPVLSASPALPRDQVCPLNVPRCRWGCHEFVRPIFLGPPSASPASPPESASTRWSPHPSWACCCCCCSPSCCSASPRHPPGRTCSSTTYSRRQCEAPFPADSPPPPPLDLLLSRTPSAWDPHP